MTMSISTRKLDPRTLFTRHERIGKGSFGSVYKGLDTRNGGVVAIKIIDIDKAEDEIEDIQQEIMVLSQCQSPYVTQYYGSYLAGSHIWIIMEYLGGGSALDLLRAGPLAEPSICIIIRGILKVKNSCLFYFLILNVFSLHFNFCNLFIIFVPQIEPSRSTF